MIVRNTVAVIALVLGSLFGLIDSVGELHPFGLGALVAAFADQPIAPKPNLVKVAAVH